MEFKKQKGIYEQIAEKILFDILNGHLTEGDRIASVRDLAQELQVNPNTVMRSYTYLNDEDIIQNQRGVGYFISTDAKQKAKQILKAQFFTDQLPEMAELMKVLDISPDDLLRKLNDLEGRV